MESILVNFKSKSDFNLVSRLLRKMKIDYMVIKDEPKTKITKDQFLADFEQSLIEVKEGKNQATK